MIHAARQLAEGRRLAPIAHLRWLLGSEMATPDTSMPKDAPPISPVSHRAHPSQMWVMEAVLALLAGFGSLRGVSALWGGGHSPSASTKQRFPAQEAARSPVSYLTNQIDSGQTSPDSNQDLCNFWSSAKASWNLCWVSGKTTTAK